MRLRPRLAAALAAALAASLCDASAAMARDYADDAPPPARAWDAGLKDETDGADGSRAAPETVTNPHAPAATITVNTAVDEDTANGVCSLREAIVAANTNAAYRGCVAGSAATTDTIAFNAAVVQINLASELPEIQNRVFVDGSLGFGNRVRLNAAALGVGADVFQIDTEGVTIANTQIYNGPGGGGAYIYAQTGTAHTFFFNYLGVTDTSTSCLSGGVSRMGSYGVYLGNPVTDAAVYGNIVACNATAGIMLSGADNNDIGVGTIGNNIGFIGNTAAPNGIGIHLSAIGANGARNNTVRSNRIAGNTQDGIRITGNGAPNAASSSSNVVIANRVGLRQTGEAGLANGGSGVRVLNGAFGNRVGGTANSERNFISGNSDSGVRISDSELNYVLGNYIGTTVTGTAKVGNAGDGVLIEGGTGNYVGCTLFCTAGSLKSNRIGGNGGRGVRIVGGVEHVVAGNEIGFAPGGFLGIDLGNSMTGVHVSSGAIRTLIGSGSRDDMANTIAYNGASGVTINDASTTTSTVGINTIFGNGQHGVNLTNGTSGNLITGTTIVLNTRDGISQDDDTSFNSWSRIATSGNGGLGIDVEAASMSADDVTNPELSFIEVKKVGPSIVFSGKGPSALPFYLGNRRVEIYEVAADPSGYGEGLTFVGEANLSDAGNFALSVPGSTVKCYTAFLTRFPLFGKAYSSEFSRSSCSLRLPIVTRN